MFGHNRIRTAAAQVSRARDTDFAGAMSLGDAEDVAAQLLPAFGPQGPKRAKRLNKRDLVDWMFDRRGMSLSQRARFRSRLDDRVLEVVALLERSGLIYQSHHTEYSVYWTATRAGLSALADGGLPGRN